jgi:hypothetical protein
VVDREGRELARYSGPVGSRYYGIGGRFIRIDRQGNQALVTVLPAQGGDEAPEALRVPFARLRTLPEILDDGQRLYLFAPGDRVAVVTLADSGASLAGRIALPAGTASVELQRDGETTRLLVPSAREIRVFNTAGKQTHRIKLPTVLASQYSVQALPGERLLYVGTDGRIRQMDFAGKELWQLALPTDRAHTPRASRVEEAYTLYY